VDGRIAVATDDGLRSLVQLVSPAEGCMRTVLRTGMVVRQAVPEPAGAGILFHGLRRSDRADMGVWRVVPGTDQAPVQVLAPLPASDPAVGRIGRVWSTELVESADGGQLAVQSCGADACRTRLLDLASGGVRRLDDAGQGQLVGFDRHLAVTFRAGTGLPCELIATDLATGHQAVLAAEAVGAATTVVDGRLVVAAQIVADGAESLVGIDAASARTWSLAGRPDGISLLPSGGASSAGAEVVPGRVAAIRATGDAVEIDPADSTGRGPAFVPARPATEVTR
jgi:hypothetical protein